MPRRQADQLRPVSFTPHYLVHPEGSVLVAVGDTKVICTASVDERVPPWMVGKGKGWVTAEYDMLPRATSTRNQRDSQKGKLSGRTQEISRLIGRALRAVTDCKILGERTITVDCDVIQADGGTRTASITGGFVALSLAVNHLLAKKKISASPIKDHVAAISVGVINKVAQLDLDYSLDSQAEVDMNVVMTGLGSLVEIQGTAEGAPFDRAQLNIMMDLAFSALPKLVELQKQAIATPLGQETVTVRG